MYALIENEKVADLLDDASNFLREEPKSYEDDIDKKTLKKFRKLAKRIDAINHDYEKVVADYYKE